MGLTPGVVQMELLRERFVLSLYIVVLLAASLLADAVLNAADILNDGAEALAIGAVLATAWWRWQIQSAGAAARAALEAACAFAAFAVVLYWTSDHSYDGTHYHLPATIALKEGWNRFYETSGGIWADHYANGVWALRAQIADVTEKMDTGRIVNIAPALASYHVLAYYLTLGRAAPFGLAQKILVLLCAASPIVIAEILTNCVDGLLASLFLILAVCLMMSSGQERNNTALAGAVAATVLIINTKMSGLYFAFCIIAAAVMGRWAQNGFSLRWLRLNGVMAGALFAGGVAAVCLVGYRPYVTNVLEYGAIVHPPVRQIFGEFYPRNLVDAGHLTKFIYGVFSETGSYALKWPWQIQWREITMSNGFAAGGFGPLFGLVVLCAAALLGFGLYYGLRAKRAVNLELLFVSGAITVICAGFPEGWAARFIPMAPAAVILWVLSVEANLPRFAVWGFAAVVVLNLAPTGAKALWSGYAINMHVGDSISKLKETPGGSKVIISADGQGNWHGHFVQRLLAENGVAASFGVCERRATLPGPYPYSQPQLCVSD